MLCAAAGCDNADDQAERQPGDFTPTPGRSRVEWTDDGCAELPDGIPNGAEPTDPTMLCLTNGLEAEAIVTY